MDELITKTAATAMPDASSVAANGDASALGTSGADSALAKGHHGIKADSANVDAGIDVGHSKGGHLSHHEVHEGKRGNRLLSEEDDKSSLSEAWSASKEKWLSGAAMFAGFAALLGACVTLVGEITILGMGAGPVIGAGLAGALWMGGNEFVKTYRAAREREDSRLNKAIGKVKDGIHHAKDKAQDKAQDKAHGLEEAVVREIGELGVVAGSLKSHLGGTGTLVVIPEAALEAPAPNQIVQRILEQGPRRAESLIDLRDGPKTNAERLAARSQELLDQAASL